MKLYYSKDGYLIKWDDLTQLKNGDYLFCTKRFDKGEIEISFPNLLSGRNMFYRCYNLTSFDGDLSSLSDGYRMFYQCYNLTSFDGDLSSLSDGYGMFDLCTSLTSFSGDLSSLVSGSYMFYSTSLTSFNEDLSSLVDGNMMFRSCSLLTSFSGDLSSLVNGSSMFQNTSLESFSGDLSNLVYGIGMFYGCKLNKESVKNIINCLKNSNTCSGAASLTLGIDASLKTDTELQTLLGITTGSPSTTLTGHGGGTWSIKLEWN